MDGLRWFLAEGNVSSTEYHTKLERLVDPAPA
jgi:hypothetical protein